MNMSLRVFYPWTTTMIVIGLAAVGYGIQSGSFLMLVEGMFLLWFASKVTLDFIALQNEV